MLLSVKNGTRTNTDEQVFLFMVVGIVSVVPSVNKMQIYLMKLYAKRSLCDIR